MSSNSRYSFHLRTETIAKGMKTFILLGPLVFLQNFGMMVSVFDNSPGDLGSIPVRVIPKTQKMVLDVSFLNTQQYKVGIKGKVKQSRERSSALAHTLV